MLVDAKLDVIRKLLFVTCIVGSSAASCGERALLSRDDMSVIGFEIGRSSLSDIQAGMGEVNLMPRREHEPYRICYLSQSMDAYVVFEAGPMGGWDRITSFTISLGGDAEKILCGKSNIPSDKLSTASGLKLGMAESSIRDRFGQPTRETATTLTYLQEVPIFIERDEELLRFDRTMMLKAQFNNAKLTALTISKIETN